MKINKQLLNIKNKDNEYLYKGQNYISFKNENNQDIINELYINNQVLNLKNVNLILTKSFNNNLEMRLKDKYTNIFESVEKWKNELNSKLRAIIKQLTKKHIFLLNENNGKKSKNFWKFYDEEVKFCLNKTDKSDFDFNKIKIYINEYKNMVKYLLGKKLTDYYWRCAVKEKNEKTTFDMFKSIIEKLKYKKVLEDIKIISEDIIKSIDSNSLKINSVEKVRLEINYTNLKDNTIELKSKNIGHKYYNTKKWSFINLLNEKNINYKDNISVEIEDENYIVSARKFLEVMKKSFNSLTRVKLNVKNFKNEEKRFDLLVHGYLRNTKSQFSKNINEDSIDFIYSNLVSKLNQAFAKVLTKQVYEINNFLYNQNKQTNSLKQWKKFIKNELFWKRHEEYKYQINYDSSSTQQLLYEEIKKNKLNLSTLDIKNLKVEIYIDNLIKLRNNLYHSKNVNDFQNYKKVDKIEFKNNLNSSQVNHLNENIDNKYKYLKDFYVINSPMILPSFKRIFKIIHQNLTYNEKENVESIFKHELFINLISDKDIEKSNDKFILKYIYSNIFPIWLNKNENNFSKIFNEVLLKLQDIFNNKFDNNIVSQSFSELIVELNSDTYLVDNLKKDNDNIKNDLHLVHYFYALLFNYFLSLNSIEQFCNNNKNEFEKHHLKPQLNTAENQFFALLFDQSDTKTLGQIINELNKLKIRLSKLKKIKEIDSKFYKQNPLIFINKENKNINEIENQLKEVHYLAEYIKFYKNKPELNTTNVKYNKINDSLSDVVLKFKQLIEQEKNENYFTTSINNIANNSFIYTAEDRIKKWNNKIKKVDLEDVLKISATSEEYKFKKNISRGSILVNGIYLWEECYDIALRFSIHFEVAKIPKWIKDILKTYTQKEIETYGQIPNCEKLWKDIETDPKINHLYKIKEVRNNIMHFNNYKNPKYNLIKIINDTCILASIERKYKNTVTKSYIRLLDKYNIVLKFKVKNQKNYHEYVVSTFKSSENKKKKKLLHQKEVEIYKIILGI